MLPPNIQKNPYSKRMKDAFRNEHGAIDLASIMVGIIVIGVIGGVIAASVFTVIPWAQDNAAKHQLDSIVAAESAYKGFTSDSPPALLAPVHSPNTYGDSSQLADAKLLVEDDAYCVMTVGEGKGYQGFARSASSNIFYVTDQQSDPRLFEGVLPDGCAYLATERDAGSVEPTVPESPSHSDTQIVMTYESPTDQTVTLPIQNGEGIATWSDGVITPLEAGGAPITKALSAGQEYTVTFEGTAEKLSSAGLPGAEALRGVTHIGQDTGIVDASSAFAGSVNLTDVPKQIPGTITDMSKMFQGATAFNDPDIKEWDVSNVEKMPFMFSKAPNFTQDLSSWDTSSVTNMAFVMGEGHWLPENIDYNPLPVTTVLRVECPSSTRVVVPTLESISDLSFTWSDGEVGHLTKGSSRTTYYSRIVPANTPLTVVVEGAYNWFSTNDSISGASACLKSFDHWGVDTGVTDGSRAFQNVRNFKLPSSIPATLTNFNQAFYANKATTIDFAPMREWDTSNITDMSYMFDSASVFNENINGWETGNVVNMEGMFRAATAFNQPLDQWDTSRVTNMSRMFESATVFNQNIDSWETGNVTDMSQMFRNTRFFDQPLASWDVSKVTNMTSMFHDSLVFNQSLNSWNVSNVITASTLFSGAKRFNGDISQWNTSNITNMSRMFYEASAFNVPLNDWDVKNVQNFTYTFYGATAFNQPLNKWNTSNATDMTYMFWATKAYKNDISNWDVSKVTKSSGFRGGLSAMTASQSPFGV